MREFENGAIANPDEKRMVGHHSPRAPQLAPNDQIRQEIEQTNARSKEFAGEIHRGKIAGSGSKRFRQLLLIGIGGSTLGPQFVADALGPTADQMSVHFFDNTDPDGFDRVLAELADDLARHARDCHLEIRRNEGNAQRPAGSGGCFCGA